MWKRREWDLYEPATVELSLNKRVCRKNWNFQLKVGEKLRFILGMRRFHQVSSRLTRLFENIKLKGKKRVCAFSSEDWGYVWKWPWTLFVLISTFNTNRDILFFFHLFSPPRSSCSIKFFSTCFYHSQLFVFNSFLWKKCTTPCLIVQISKLVTLYSTAECC